MARGAWRLAAAAIATAAQWGSFPAAAAQTAASSVAVLQGLDKVTARISTIRAPVDVPVRFGTLLIQARTCHKTPPEEPPETAVFLEIYDTPSGGPPDIVFTGWMFASSPALSALEHPVYDIWALDCASESTSSGAASSGSE
jgi:hypothetical protein